MASDPVTAKILSHRDKNNRNFEAKRGRFAECASFRMCVYCVCISHFLCTEPSQLMRVDILRIGGVSSLMGFLRYPFWLVKLPVLLSEGFGYAIQRCIDRSMQTSLSQFEMKYTHWIS